MITAKRHYNTMEYIGLSTDTKPVKTANGSTFYEMDTCKTYMFDADSSSWLEQTPSTQPLEPEE